MKNIFLIATILFTLGSISEINAKNMHETLIPHEPATCLERAWNYGTFMGDGDPRKEYRATDYYYNTYCR